MDFVANLNFLVHPKFGKLLEFVCIPNVLMMVPIEK